MTDSTAPEVLIVEDEPSVAEGYELWLRDGFSVGIATDGREGLERIDDTVEVVLLDRMLPDISGRDVLSEIRNRGVDCRVVMVTAVEPDFDVIEMGFDDYITKPPEREELVETVQRMIDRGSLDDEMNEYHSLIARRSALESQKSADELKNSEAYADLLERIEAQESTVDEKLGDMRSEIDFVSAVRDLENASEKPSSASGTAVEGDSNGGETDEESGES